MADAPRIDIYEARYPFPGVMTAGQPTPAQMKAAVEAGYRLLINLRGHGEVDVDEAPGRAESLGATYVHIPVDGPSGVTLENARRLAAALADADARPAMVYCGSSNRVGALFALKARFLDGASVDEALEQGRAAGLLGLEGYVRQLLQG
ncbi:MAG: hypothetical protein KC583_03715 [Myxococcales bacterium]|nr:hypothetical protein [Myxococcales bacterium]